MIRDINDNPVRNFPDAIPWTVSHQYSIRVDCHAGWFLKTAGAVADMVVEGRHSGSSTWIDLESTGISLTTWDGTPQAFDIKITAGAGTGIVRRVFDLRAGT